MRSNEDSNECCTSEGPQFSPRLYLQRYRLTRDILSNSSEAITRIGDFGCAEGKFLRYIKKLPEVEEIACIDCDNDCLEQCVYEARPLAWDVVFGRSKELKINVFKGSVAQKDSRLIGFDAITCIELIEHLTNDVLSELPDNIFGFIKPKLVIITTPNVEFNVLFPQLKDASKLRHWDHKFEWTRHEFDIWCANIINIYPEYSYEMTGVGEPPLEYQYLGYCTQIAVFKRHFNTNNQFSAQFHSLANHSNYKLLDQFYYHKNDNNCDKKVEPLIYWDSVLN